MKYCTLLHSWVGLVCLQIYINEKRRDFWCILVHEFISSMGGVTLSMYPDPLLLCKWWLCHPCTKSPSFIHEPLIPARPSPRRRRQRRRVRPARQRGQGLGQKFFAKAIWAGPGFGLVHGWLLSLVWFNWPGLARSSQPIVWLSWFGEGWFRKNEYFWIFIFWMY